MVLQPLVLLLALDAGQSGHAVARILAPARISASEWHEPRPGTQKSTVIRRDRHDGGVELIRLVEYE